MGVDQGEVDAAHVLGVGVDGHAPECESVDGGRRHQVGALVGEAHQAASESSSGRPPAGLNEAVKTKRSASMPSSRAWTIVAFTESLTTAAMETRASPTVRAAAVAAVRRGDRRAFSTGQPPRCPEEAPDRAAQEVGDGPGDHRAEQVHAEEGAEGTEAQAGQKRARVKVDGHADGEEGDADQGNEPAGL